MHPQSGDAGGRLHLVRLHAVDKPSSVPGGNPAKKSIERLLVDNIPEGLDRQASPIGIFAISLTEDEG